VDDRLRDASREALFAVVAERALEGVRPHMAEPFGRRRPVRRAIHPHVERTVTHERETASRRVELERTDAEVEEDPVGTLEADVAESRRDVGVRGMPEGDPRTAV